VRFAVGDPDECERQAAQAGLPVVWPAQDAAWGRFVVLADPDGRPVVLARTRQPKLRSSAAAAEVFHVGSRCAIAPVPTRRSE